MEDIYRERTYGAETTGYGDKPGIVVVDFQTGFTDPQYPLAGAPLVARAVDNTARLAGVPVVCCYTAYASVRDMPHWKVAAVREQFIHGHPCTELDPRIYDASYDVPLCKTGASIFFQTPVTSYFAKERVDTVIVTGCVTSGCIHASVLDAMSHGFRPILISDCVGDRDEGAHEANLRVLGQIYADLMTRDEAIAELSRR